MTATGDAQAAGSGHADGFVLAAAGSLVDGSGRPTILRGVGLGNWLLPEGYMWRFPTDGPQSPRQIEQLVLDLLGAAAATAFWQDFRDMFIREADVVAISAAGFDHVRLPLNARDLIDAHGALIPAGLAPIDRLIGWCRRHSLGVVLDLHAAPGGQTGTNIDDSPRGLPDLFLEGGRHRELTVELWRRLAMRYRDETAVWAYDLLNEPLPHEYADRFAGDLVSLYRELTATIRSVDSNHLLVYEGTQWSTNWSIFEEAWDENAMLSFHKYWSPPDRASVEPYLAIARRHGLPIYMGEGGENRPEWLQRAFGLYEDLGISWNFWPWKKLGTWTSPVSVRPPEDWAELVAFASGDRGADRALASAALRALPSASRVEMCDRRDEVVNGLFHRVPLRLAAAAMVSDERDDPAAGEVAGSDPRPPGAGDAAAGRGPRPPGAGDAAAGGDPGSPRTIDARPRSLLRRADGGGGMPSFDHVDVPDELPELLEIVLRPGEPVAYRVEVRQAARVGIDIVHGDEGIRPGATVGHVEIVIDGKPLEVGTDGMYETPALVACGRHFVTLRSVDQAAVVRALVITEVA